MYKSTTRAPVSLASASKASCKPSGRPRTQRTWPPNSRPAPCASWPPRAASARSSACRASPAPAAWPSSCTSRPSRSGATPARPAPSAFASASEPATSPACLWGSRASCRSSGTWCHSSRRQPGWAPFVGKKFSGAWKLLFYGREKFS